MIKDCRSQFRMALSGAYALDYGAILAFGAGRGVDAELLTAVLPAAEDAIISAMHGETGEADD